VLLSFDSLSDYFSTWDAQFEQYQGLVREKELSLLEYALNFALNTQELDKILVGVGSVSQLTDIVNAFKSDVDLKAFKIDDINLLNPNLWN
jgi:aryl-alcohol dehydrogenase-like predicted oxidoreductase